MQVSLTARGRSSVEAPAAGKGMAVNAVLNEGWGDPSLNRRGEGKRKGCPKAVITG